MWPTDPASLVAIQRELAAATPDPWRRSEHPVVGGAWVCFPFGASGPGADGDPAWAAAVALRRGRDLARHVVAGRAGAPYLPGLMALRTGPLLEEAVRGLPSAPDVLLVDATGRDHPQRAGLAVHLGAVLDLPTIGVTHRPLVGHGEWPADVTGATSPVRVDGDTVACWVRTRQGTRPLVVHQGWRTDLSTAVDVVVGMCRRRRTPEPLRRAREVARRARAGDLRT